MNITTLDQTKVTLRQPEVTFTEEQWLFLASEIIHLLLEDLPASSNTFWFVLTVQ
jgi:hypothetical protein